MKDFGKKPINRLWSSKGYRLRSQDPITVFFLKPMKLIKYSLFVTWAGLIPRKLLFDLKFFYLSMGLKDLQLIKS